MLRMLLEDLKKKLMETDRTGIRMQSTNKYSICDCWHIYMCVCVVWLPTTRKLKGAIGSGNPWKRLWQIRKENVAQGGGSVT